MTKIRCQAEDPNACRYHNPVNPDQKFLIPKTPRTGTVLSLLERKQEGLISVKYPIERTFRIQHDVDTNTLISYLKKNNIPFSAQPDFNSWQMVFTITAHDEAQLRHLAGIEKQKMLSDTTYQYVQLKMEAEAITKQNVWRKRLKKPLLEQPEVLPYEDWLAILGQPYQSINSEKVPHIRF